MNENKKYELTEEVKEYFNKKCIIHRIKALKDFGNVKKGELGGFVESEDNLSQDGNCWIYDDARVVDNARVSGNAMVCDKAVLLANAQVYDDAKVYDNAEVYGDALVSDNARVFDYAKVYGNAEVYGSAHISGNAKVYDDAKVYGKARVFGKADVYGNAEIGGDVEVKSMSDYMVFKNNWSSGRYFTWTRSNDMWRVGCFYGTGKQLIEKAYKDSEESGKKYETTVKDRKSTRLNSSHQIIS